MSFFVDSLLAAFHLLVEFDAEVYLIAWTSLKVSLVGASLASLTGVPLGLLIAFTEFRGKRGVLLLLNTLMSLPTVVIGLIFYGLLSRQGPLGDLGILFTPAGVSLGLFVLALPLIANLSIAAVHGLDPRVALTCRALGATPLQQAWMIVKEARFAVICAIVVGFGRVISEVGIAMMLGGNIKGFTRTLTTAIALETSKGEFELGLALGMFLLIIAFGVNGLLFLFQRAK
ncbi:MAG: ABC transporter permease [Thermodesulfobacteriota bacterium]